MALALVVDKLEAVAEAHRALYAEKDGKFHLDVSGLEDTTGLKSALQKERDAVKEAKRLANELTTRFAGIDPDKVRGMMEKLDQDGEAQLIAAGKIDEVINKRTEKLRADLQKQLDAEAGKTKAADERSKKFSQRVLDNHIRAASATAGLHKHAVEDALFRARQMFALNDEGDAVQIGADGAVVLGKDGKTPFSPSEWLEGMKEIAPHWFPAGGSGGSATGGAGGDAGGKTITRANFNLLNDTDKRAVVKTHKIVD